MRIVHPDRPAKRKRNEMHLLPISRDVRQIGPHPLHERVEGRWRSLQDRHRADVHMADRVLEVQERSVLRAQALHDVISTLAARVPPVIRTDPHRRSARYRSPASPTGWWVASEALRTSTRVRWWRPDPALDDVSDSIRCRTAQDAGRASRPAVRPCLRYPACQLVARSRAIRTPLRAVRAAEQSVAAGAPSRQTTAYLCSGPVSSLGPRRFCPRTSVR